MHHTVGDRVVDYAVFGAAGTAPAWVSVLSTINVVLGTISMALTIGFVLWRWRRNRHRTPPEQD